MTYKKILLASLLLFAHVIIVVGQGSYDAHIGNKEILTPKPGPQPLINGPKIYGARPGKIFIYRIPCQGQRPIDFQVEGLPKGLVLDDVNGIISGRVPAVKGNYQMTFIAKNTHGSVSRPFKLVVGDKLALTPPTGWNTWGGHMLLVSDSLIRKAAAIFVNKGFADVGFRYIGIDDCWMRMNRNYYNLLAPEKKKTNAGYPYLNVVGNERDSVGNIVPNDHFPNMKALTDNVHSYGLKIGIYSSPGVATCQGFEGSFGHQLQDAKQYANWGFDLLKYDLCSGSKDLKRYREEKPGYTQKEYWAPMACFIKNQDRDILFNLCQYGHNDPWKWAPSLGISSWRTGGDLNQHVDTYFKQALRLATTLRDYSKPGQWNDPDFMYIDRIRNHLAKVQPSHEIPLNTNQRYQYVTLWSIIDAPFFFSCDMNKIDDFTIRLLTNSDVMNINQDELGAVGKVVRNENNEVIMVKKLADGTKALAVFNTDHNKESVVQVNWEDIDECCGLNVYDVWRQKKLGFYKGGIDVRLSADGVAYFIIKED